MEATFPDGSVHRFPPCASGAPRVRGSVSMPTLPADYDGWLAYTATKATGPAYDSFLGSFSTPDAPKEVPQVLYLFTGEAPVKPGGHLAEGDAREPRSFNCPRGRAALCQSNRCFPHACQPPRQHRSQSDS